MGAMTTPIGHVRLRGYIAAKLECGKWQAEENGQTNSHVLKVGIYATPRMHHQRKRTEEAARQT
eukprot:1037948-Pyramimonas_sp.AAC.1